MTDVIINGIARHPTSEGDTPLLWYLRDELGLTGTRLVAVQDYAAAVRFMSTARRSVPASSRLKN
jgi:aerobic-type carbon monoxide dehydrogenase small subunit (CoxS/CutS family)